MQLHCLPIISEDFDLSKDFLLPWCCTGGAAETRDRTIQSLIEDALRDNG